MLSCRHFNFTTYVHNTDLKSYYQSVSFLCKTSVNKMVLFYNRIGHRNQHILKHILKVKSAHLSRTQIQAAL